MILKMPSNCFIACIFYFSLSSLTGFAQKQGQDWVDSLLHEVSVIKEDSTKVKILSNLAFYYSNRNPEEGLKHGLKAIEFSEKHGYKKHAALAYFSVGVNYATLAKHAQALEYEKKALELYIELEDLSGVAAMFANISNIYLTQGDYPKALEYSMEALRMNEELGNQSKAAMIKGNIGTIYFRQKSYNKALEYYQKAKMVYEKEHDRTGIARSTGNMGMVFKEKGDYTKALKYQLKALQLNRELGANRTVQINLVNVGNAYQSMGNYKTALNYYLEALRLGEKLAIPGSVATTKGNIGITYLSMAKHDALKASKEVNLKKADQYLVEAINECTELKLNDPIIEFSEMLSEVNALAGDHASALLNYRKYTGLKDSIFSAHNYERIAALESNREIELRDKDIELKNKQLEINKLTLEQHRNQIIIYITGIALLIAVVVIILRYLRKYIASHRVLDRKNKEQLAKINEQVQAIREHSKVMREIAYTQAHDIRGPLSTLLGLVQLFNYQDPTDPNNQIVLDNISQITEKLDAAVQAVIKKENDWEN